MIARKTEDLETVMEKLRTIIENKQTVQLNIGTSTLGHFHDAVLLTKVFGDKVLNVRPKTDLEALSEEVAELRADYISEAEDLIYCLFDKILKDEVTIK